MTEKEQASIGIIGGTGFYSFFEGSEVKKVEIDTPYGKPSDTITIGTVRGKKVAFLPRHGNDHRFLPHTINYRANVWALHSLGVKRVISPCAAGSLQKNVKPGEFVVCDQYVDWTDARKSTFFEGPVCVHPSAADPYCPELRKIAIEAAKKDGISVHETGTVVIINGPRFTTKSESKFFTNQGWEVINMSQFPEVHLVKELDMCPVTIALITDYDAGLVGDVPPVTHQEVTKVFKDNIENLKKMLLTMIEAIPDDRNTCDCQNTSHTS
ncbi:MAG: S-methyl-5'-thioadenosine phosphorylase [Candidatus Gastranaerophilales bacterium]|nr:S-methyl-5'-thioadenosine phosphorylase [Candidatus Gastranaerophilales bacterium]